MFISKKCRNLVKKPALIISRKEETPEVKEVVKPVVKVEEAKPKKKVAVKPVEVEIAENKEEINL